MAATAQLILSDSVDAPGRPTWVRFTCSRLKANVKHVPVPKHPTLTKDVLIAFNQYIIIAAGFKK